MTASHARRQPYLRRMRIEENSRAAASEDSAHVVCLKIVPAEPARRRTATGRETRAFDHIGPEQD